MQKYAVLTTNNKKITFHNMSFSALDSAKFLGFGCKKTKSAFFFLQKTKNMEPSEI